MSHQAQNYTARRFQAAHSSAGYDCEPPDNVLEELGRPRRPQILGRQLPVKTERRWPFYLMLAFCLAALGAAIYSSRRQQEALRTSSTVSQQPLAPQPMSTSVTLPPGNASRWREYLANNPPAPRATLIMLPPLRAQLVRLPSSLPPLIIGKRYLATMPYNLEVLATYRGEMASVDMLPSHRNRIGDTWIVNGTPWVWLVTPGTSAPQWVDP
jgi:hypothetical protein